MILGKNEVPIHPGMPIPKPRGVFGGVKFLRVVWSWVSGLANIEFKIQGGIAKVTTSPRKIIVDLTKLAGTGGSGSGFRWAASKKYDSTRPHNSEEVVFVGPDNSSGAMVGLWVAAQNVPAGNIPVWPPPGLTEDEAMNAPDSPQIFWVPLWLLCV